MSYCRFGEADVYIYESTLGGFDCAWCSLDKTDDGLITFTTPTEEGMLEHIAKHRAAGEYVPESVDARLREEIAEKRTQVSIDESA